MSLSILANSASKPNTASNIANIQIQQEQSSPTPIKEKPEEILATEENQATVKNFEAEILAVASPFDAAVTKASVAMTNFGDHLISTLELYQILDDTVEYIQKASSAISDIKPAKKISKEVDNLLSDARNDISTSYYFKKEAFKKILKFIDDKKTSQINEATKELKSANAMSMSGFIKINKAKIAVGVISINEATDEAVEFMD